MHIYRRIEITIPLTKETLDKINDFIVELRNRFKGLRWSSFSSSEYSLESAYHGWGLNIKGEFDLDMVTVIFTDVNPEEIHIERFAKEIKQRMEEKFEPQKVWMIMHDIILVE
mgnify:CR=1 FL=1